jgi:hypothetical protein
MTHDYRRNETLDLFVAMNVATGEVLHDAKKRHAGCAGSPQAHRPARPAGQERHVALDNLSAYKSVTSPLALAI